jgi:hypothetical protein
MKLEQIDKNLKPLKDAFNGQDGISEKTAADVVADSNTKAEKEVLQLYRKIESFRDDAAKNGHMAQADDIICGDVDRVIDDITRRYISLEDATKLYQKAVDEKMAIS